MIQENIARVLDRIAAVCRRVDRDPGGITLVGITKYAEVSEIEEAIAAGLTHIGENKVQEAKRKFAGLLDAPAKVTRHMVGHLQSNKVKQALELFDCIQSVDSLDLVAAIEKHAARSGKTVDILAQVNTSAEHQKFGIAPEEALDFIAKAVTFEHVRLRGLMAIAPMAEQQDDIRKCFRDLRFLRDQALQHFVRDRRVSMQYLSMGMTNDFEIAIEEGANMVRIGRAIFT